MRLLLLCIPAVVAAIPTYFIGRSRGTVHVLGKEDQKELKELRDMRESLISTATEHAVLGDDYAVVVIDTIFKNRDKPPRNQQR